VKSESLGSGLSKHEQIIRFIKNLEINTKVSVRQIAKEMGVSEGTAYRAIKEAENQGLVSSIPKVGTIRIQAEEEREIEDLNLREISLIIEAEVICGENRLSQIPARFVIGSSNQESLKKSLEENALVIVGDLPELMWLSLKEGCHLLVSGGYKVAPELVQYAEEHDLVILSSAYEAFEAVSLLNRAVYERLEDKELLRVEDIMVKDVHYLQADETVESWYQKSVSSGHSRFPVVDANMKVIGIVTAVDVAGLDRNSSILSAMTKDVLTVERKTLVTHLSRLLLWEGYELVPIVEDGKLIGVVSRQDILKAFQQAQKQPQIGETVDNLVLSGFKLEEWEEGTKISGEITQFMINEYGAASPGVLMTIISIASYIVCRRSIRKDTVPDNFTVHQMELLSVEEKAEVFAQIVHLEKKTCVTEVSVYGNGILKAKALLSSRIIKK